MTRLIQGARYQWQIAHASRPANSEELLELLLSDRCDDDRNLFLQADLSHLADPFLLRDMAKAVELLDAAIQQSLPILVYGDFDVDGTVGTAMLVRFLRELGARVDYFIPSRFTEGYGLNRAALESRSQDFHLLISVDCGITAIDEVAFLKSLGKQVIITDHHLPGNQLPPADAIVDPHRPDCPYPHAICGAAVVLKLITALRRTMGRAELSLAPYLPLASLATVADVMEIRHENRVLVKQGLRLFADKAVTGLRLLCEVAGIDPGKMSVYGLGFQLGPRVNAAGRMENARDSVELFLLDEPQREQALSIARQLDDLNRQRQEVEQSMVEEAREQIQRHKLHEQRAIIVGSRGWNEGVIGIVAGRLKSRYHRPCIVYSQLEDGTLKASCRSVDGIDLHHELQQCAHHLVKFGGHAMAAGLQIQQSNLEAFRQNLLKNLSRFPEDLFKAKCTVDACLPAPLLSMDTAHAINRLEPFGNGNPEPLFSGDFTVLDSYQCGREGSHCRLTIQDSEGKRHQAIAFSNNLQAAVGKQVKLCFKLRVNHFRGKDSLEMQIEDHSYH
ncbi:single-stranded-DNA-specific exonuclease RecJ [Desulfurispirillum indicum]|uniref:single-stranded-DNA-specific exonuclease RecJ n=1 Tax=Desulfurispirillum indicum TaxID=936456 RepID=UPI001CFB6FEA|nr:single-stranded-DNA-specific exonuclease RecJ [Desulfurispirillum indicum]UCZ57448.1 single-stranded-DNA-specific exonuclease RecJ [Desulfurispirillum indicum]